MDVPRDPGQLQVLWVTNVMAPYRRTLWESVGQRTKLQIIAVEGGDRRIVSPQSASDWGTRGGLNFQAENLSAFRFRWGARWFHVTGRIGTVLRSVKNSDVILVGSWESPVYWQYLLAARLMKRPTVLFQESTNRTAHFRGGPVRIAKSFIFRSCEAVVVPGAASRESVRDLGVPEERIFEGFNAVDVQHFRPLSGGASKGISQDQHAWGHHYLYVGQLIERKRPEAVIREFARIRTGGDRLVLVGKGPLKESLAELARKLDLGDSVTFTGSVSYENLPEIYFESHTLVLPSSVEVWGLVVNEALAAGRHVVVSEHCGVADSVRKMEGVFVWREGEGSLGDVMLRSARKWQGPIEQPEILDFTNDRFAEVFVNSFRFVSGLR